MPKFLYGSVAIMTLMIEADDEKAALKLIERHKYQGPDKIKTTYQMHWAEMPGGDITAERDGVLLEFLNVMHTIPRPDAEPKVIISLEDYINGKVKPT